MDDMPLIDFEIPEGTTEISETTFQNHRLVRSVKIPDSILVIGERAFADCINLKEIKFPKELMAIGKEAFKNCIALEELEIPEGITTIEESTFEDCAGLESVILPESLTSIKDKAFANCTGIKNLVLPDNLTSCSSTAFPNSQKYLPINKVYKYDNGMMVNTSNEMLLFYNGKKKFVVTPDYVKGIAFRAFYGCTHLEQVRISEGTKSVSDEAFTNCGSARVIIPESVEYMENSAFDPSVKVFCRKGSYAEGWCRNNPDYQQLCDEEA